MEDEKLLHLQSRVLSETYENLMELYACEDEKLIHLPPRVLSETYENRIELYAREVSKCCISHLLALAKE